MPTFALLIWPVITLVIFANLPLTRAMIWSVMLGYMFLPEAFGLDFPGLPPFEKSTVIVGSVFLGVWINQGRRPARGGVVTSPGLEPVENSAPRFGMVMIGLIVVLFCAPLATIAVNQTPVFVGRTLPGLGVRDLISTTFNSLTLMVPFLLARRYLATPSAHRMMLGVLLIGGLIYTLFALVEMRLSPQLHNWVYGFHQHSFTQHIRGGDFRPKIFLRHGLWVGFFFFTMVMVAGALSRGRGSRGGYLLACGWLLLILFLSKNVAATLLAVAFLPVLLLLGRGWQVRIAVAVAVIFLAYPAVRQSNLVDVTAITEVAAQYSPDRAQSFQFRLDNEDALLARALEQPVFGWGGWGRSRIYDAVGVETSVTDGLWIIVLGAQGWVGYIVFFGLLTAPILALPFTRRRKDIPIETMVMALVMAGNFIYLIPNSALNPIGWLFAGALAGFVQFDPVKVQEDAKEKDSPRPRLGYTRFAQTVRVRGS